MNFEGMLKGTEMRKDLPAFEVGDTIKVHYKIIEESRERVQIFNGVVIAMKGTGVNANFTVRRMAFGEGMEKIIPMHSPRIDKIEITKKGKVRRSKLYYLRDKVGKSARLKERAQLYGEEALVSAPAAEAQAVPAAQA